MRVPGLRDLPKGRSLGDTLKGFFLIWLVFFNNVLARHLPRLMITSGSRTSKDNSAGKAGTPVPPGTSTASHPRGTQDTGFYKQSDFGNLTDSSIPDVLVRRDLSQNETARNPVAPQDQFVALFKDFAEQLRNMDTKSFLSSEVPLGNDESSENAAQPAHFPVLLRATNDLINKLSDSELETFANQNKEDWKRMIHEIVSHTEKDPKSKSTYNSSTNKNNSGNITQLNSGPVKRSAESDNDFAGLNLDLTGYFNDKTPGWVPECGILTPSADNWDADLDSYYRSWIKAFWDQFIYTRGRDVTFPEFLRRKYAPSLAPTEMVCDGIGACSIRSCTQLNMNHTTEDRQMAYHTFLKLANINHSGRLLSEAVNDVTDSMGNVYEDYIKRFGWVDSIANAAERKRQETKLAILTTTLVLTFAIAAVTAAPAAGLLAGASGQMMGGALGGALIAANAAITVGYDAHASSLDWSSTNIVEMVDDVARIRFDVMSRITRNAIQVEINSLMKGEANQMDRTLLNLLSSHETIKVKPNQRLEVGRQMARVWFAFMVNMIWEFDRCIVVWSKVMPGKTCLNDDRGWHEYKECLEERPGDVFYVQCYHRGFEKKSSEIADVRGPKGWWRFRSGGNATHGFTTKDIVRSSVWKYEATRAGKYKHKNSSSQDWDRKHKLFHAGSMPGGFTLPVAYNPGGEAISAIHEEASPLPIAISLTFRPGRVPLSGFYGTNYPCMVGDFSWNGALGKGQNDYGEWTKEKDETGPFLLESGLYASEDYLHFCEEYSNCEVAKGIRFKFPYVDPTRTLSTFGRKIMKALRILSPLLGNAIAEQWKKVTAGNKWRFIQRPFRKCRSNTHRHKGDYNKIKELDPR